MTESRLAIPGPTLLSQFACPHGPLAQKTACVMNVGNRRLNQLAVQALAPADRERVLDVGFGGGVGIAELLERPGRTRAVGIDPSGEMVTGASERFAEHIRSHRIEVVKGWAESLPWDDGSFDGAISVNSVYFWRDVEAGLSEIRRVLRASGRVVLGGRCLAELRATRLDHHGYNLLGEADLCRLLSVVGFADVTVAQDEDPTCGGAVLVSGRRPGPPPAVRVTPRGDR